LSKEKLLKDVIDANIQAVPGEEAELEDLIKGWGLKITLMRKG